MIWSKTRSSACSGLLSVSRQGLALRLRPLPSCVIRFLNAYARPARAQSIDDVDPELFACPAGQEQRIEYREFRSAFSRLPRSYREVLILAAGSAMNYTEIASICGRAEGTVKSRVFRARAELSRLFDRQKNTSSGREKTLLAGAASSSIRPRRGQMTIEPAALHATAKSAALDPPTETVGANQYRPSRR
jgi:hypothetical protein